jgi:hypothetical protein
VNFTPANFSQRVLVPTRDGMRFQSGSAIRSRFFFKSDSTGVTGASRVSQAVVNTMTANVIYNHFHGSLEDECEEE